MLDVEGREGYIVDEGLPTEIDRSLAVNRALDSKLLAVMMSMHARLGAGSGLTVLDGNIVTMICDVFRGKSKGDKGGISLGRGGC